MANGPVQLLVISFDRTDTFQGQIRRELVDLYGRGIIRVIDALMIAKEQDGTVVGFEYSQLTDEERAEVGGVIGALIGLGGSNVASAAEASERGAYAFAHREYGMSRSDIEEVINGLLPGTAAALLLVEHTWALKLRDAVREVGGHLVAQGFLTPDALMIIGAELEAIAEAEAAIDLAEAVRGAALLEAMEAKAAAEQAIVAATAEAAAATSDAAAARSAAAIRVLIVAGLIDESAAQDALDALIEADLLDAASLQQAAQLADRKAAETDSAIAKVEAAGQRI